LLHNKFLKAIVIAGVVALVAISDFFMCSGKAKELPQPESDGTIALAPAMARGKWGLLDKKGNWFIEPRYLSIGNFSEGIVGVLDPDSKKYGFIVSSVVEEEHAGIGKDVLVPKEKDPGNFGYVNSSGEFVIKPQYSLAHKFKNGVAIVENWDKENGVKFGLIDMKGNFVKELSDDILVETDCGLIIAGKDGKVGALDGTGKNVVIPYRFEAIHRYIKYKKEDLLLNNVK